MDNAGVWIGTVVIGALILLIFVTTWYLLVRDKQILAANGGKSDGIPFSAMFVLIVLAGVVFVGLLAWIFQPDQDSASNGFGTLAGLILLGMVVFIGIMNILTLSAARIGMLDGRQPFGLPEGSVRAILTIAFIILVGVLSSFLLTGSNNRSGFAPVGVVLHTLDNQAAAEKLASEIRLTHGASALVAIEQVQVQQSPAQKPDDEGQKPDDAASKPKPEGDVKGLTSDATPAPTEFRVVIYPKVDYSVADDISKQTLTMVSTILAAMIGFYFATRSDAGAADPASVKRANALKGLRELLDETRPEEAVAAVRTQLDAFAVAARLKHKDDPDKLKLVEADIKKLEAELNALETKLKAVKRVRGDDNATFNDITTAKAETEGVNAGLVTLQKNITDKQKAL